MVISLNKYQKKLDLAYETVNDNNKRGSWKKRGEVRKIS